MKKLILVMTCICMAWNVKAQVNLLSGEARMTESNKVQESVLMPSQSVIVNVSGDNQIRKAVRKSNYVDFSWMYSWEYGVNYAGSENLAWTGSTIYLFPDSLVIPNAWYYTDKGTYSASHATLHKTGCVFDPYSNAFSSDFDHMLSGIDNETGEEYFFGKVSNDTTYYYNYRIDSVMLRFNYVMGPEKDSALLGHEAAPDTVRFYLVQYDAYTDQAGRNIDYQIRRYTDASSYPGVKFLIPKANYLKDSTTQKGSIDVPQSASLAVYDYLLDPNGGDSTLSEVGKVGWKGRYVPLSEPYEVEAGHVVAMMMEYLPSYDYQLDDTLKLTEYNSETKTFIRYDYQKSAFAVPICNYFDDSEHNYFEWLLDWGNGLNSRLMEPSKVRYYGAGDTAYAEASNAGYYVNNYYAMPMFLFKVSLGDDEYIWTEEVDTVNVREADALQVSVYPNPAQDKINVSLSNDEQATATLYNIVGQQVRIYRLEKTDNVLDLNDLASGIYMLKVQQGHKINTVKVTIR